eukprot:scaffold182225_cov31-Tisochrysis_lutea.AAC.2
MTASGRRDGERTDAAEHITNHVPFLKKLDDSPMLALKPRVPIHLAIVHMEDAAVLAGTCAKRVLSCNHLHWKDSKLVRDALHLIHDCPQARILIENYLSEAGAID